MAKQKTKKKAKQTDTKVTIVKSITDTEVKQADILQQETKNRARTFMALLKEMEADLRKLNNRFQSLKQAIAPGIGNDN